MKIKFFFVFLSFTFFICASDLPELKIEKKYNENGMDIYLNNTEYKEANYKLYNPFYKTYGNGKLKQKEKLYIPYGTEICIWLKTKSGKNSRITHFIAKPKEETEIIQVINPVAGIWKEKQILFIDAEKKTEVMYSVDGSDPSQFGLLYTEPVLIEKTGNVNLKIKAISEDGTVNEKEINYTVSDSGAPSPEFSTVKPESGTEKTSFKILNWYFIEFSQDSPVYWFKGTVKDKDVLQKEKFTIYDGPVFTERNEDEILYWYCKEIENGKINKIELPKKPELSGCPLNPVNSNVELMFEDLRFSYFSDLTEFKNGKLNFDTAVKTEKEFNVKITAFLGGIMHGGFNVKFKIDKLPPPKPNVVFNPSFSPSNKEVKINFQEIPEAELIAEISPKDYTRSKNQIILTGSEEGRTLYSINIYNKDFAGNKSPSIIKEFIIEKNALYVDTNSGSKNAEGTPSDPFSSVTDAVNYINKISFAKNGKKTESEKWKIFLRGDSILNEAVLITKNIKLISAEKRAVIRFSKNAGFVINGSSFEMENIDVFRRERPEEPREVPVIYASNAAVKLSGVKIHTVEGGSAVRAVYSHLDCSNTGVISEQTDYCVLFNLNNSSAVIRNTNFTGKGSSVAALSCSKCNIELDEITSNLTPGFTARFLEAWDSEIGLGKLNCIRNPETKNNKDTAIWYNRNSKLDIKYNPIVRGYAKPIEREP
ncbi:chitobiase/beta-hexosaminidase C-terminal domain-containing protein [Treponema pedis]|uniref:chitobiase/beta-hexosaminidase C-terminal domain-containing protein n=1 Tax=Treponema pedis TaxID=409322 RepID=UPI00040B146F|nr:chitobiase/beta-hexosaminidase C-terminal domain-containing protein [Treponema pedis]